MPHYPYAVLILTLALAACGGGDAPRPTNADADGSPAPIEADRGPVVRDTTPGDATADDALRAGFDHAFSLVEGVNEARVPINLDAPNFDQIPITSFAYVASNSFEGDDTAISAVDDTTLQINVNGQSNLLDFGGLLQDNSSKYFIGADKLAEKVPAASTIDPSAFDMVNYVSFGY